MIAVCCKLSKPFALKLPSISLDGQTMNCELCKLSNIFINVELLNGLKSILDSSTWVLFQPIVVIDAKLGSLWYVNLNSENFPVI